MQQPHRSEPPQMPKRVLLVGIQLIGLELLVGDFRAHVPRRHFALWVEVSDEIADLRASFENTRHRTRPTLKACKVL